jgi:hypothetical protein
MANIIGELLVAVLRALVKDRAYSLFVKAATWLDTEIDGRTAKTVIGLLLAGAAYFAFQSSPGVWVSDDMRTGLIVAMAMGTFVTAVYWSYRR